MAADIYVYKIDLPAGISEMVAPGIDDDYTIYINSRLSPDRQAEAYRHAVRHCEQHDFEKADVQQIEADAHDVL